MMIRKIAKTPPPMKSNNPSSILSSIRLVGAGDDRRSAATMSPAPATPVTLTTLPAGMSSLEVALNSWVWPSALTRTLP